MAKKKSKYYVRPDGLHEAIRTINGKRVAFRGHSDAEVERKMIEYQAKLEAGKTFEEVADAWETEHFPTLASNTLRSYRRPKARAVAHFGKRLIREITPPDVKAFIVDFAGQNYAKKTVVTQLQILSMIFSWAVEHGECNSNPCSCVSIPKGLKKKYRGTATPEDEKIVKASPQIWLLPFFILYTGMRKGEALAIQGRDIDRKQSVIHVTKSIYYENRKPFIKAPKTEAGCRKVPLLLPLLKWLPKKIAPDHYLFSLDGGKSPLSEGEYNRLWKEYVRSTGITCTAHQLRHSFATMIFECGLELKDCQDILGHSTAAMTQDTYTHIREARREETAKTLNKLLAQAE